MIIAIVLLWINIKIYFYQNKLSSYLKAVTAWTLYMFFITELLSFIKRLDFFGLLTAWLVLDLFLFITMLKNKVCLKNLCVGGVFTEIRRGFRWYYMILVLIALISLFFAIRIRPYNWDSMTYHLSRVDHWARNRSVGYYPTNIVRQVASPVLAEFVVTQTYIMCGRNDIFVNLIQSTAFITNALIVYGITRKLNCKPGYSFLAAFLYMTMPIAFAESTTTQVDNFAAMWMLIFAYFIIDFAKKDKQIQLDKKTIGSVVLLGICVALGYLCKPSVSISMLVFAFWILFICIARRDKISDLIKLVLCALPGMIIPIGIETARTVITFGTILPSIVGGNILVATWKPRYLFVNCMKNIAYNFPCIYIDNAETKITNWVDQLAVKLNVAIDDPGISFGGSKFSAASPRTYHIDTAANPIIVILILLCMIWIIFNLKMKKPSNVASGFSITAIVSFLVFCTVLRWQPWGTRLMIPSLAPLCVVVAVQLQKMDENEKHQKVLYAITGIIYFCCFVEFFGLFDYYNTKYHESNSVGKMESYFANRHGEYEDYIFAADYIRGNGYKNIGFFCGEDHYEYPLIKMLENDIERFEHVGVSNETLKYEDSDYMPDCIFVVGQSISDAYIYHGMEYKIVYDYGEDGKYLLIHD